MTHSGRCSSTHGRLPSSLSVGITTLTVDPGAYGGSAARRSGTARGRGVAGAGASVGSAAARRTRGAAISAAPERAKTAGAAIRMRMNTGICLAWDGGGRLYGELPLTSASAQSRRGCSGPRACWTNWPGRPSRTERCAVRCPHSASAELVRRRVRRSGHQLARGRRAARAGGLGRVRSRARRGAGRLHTHVVAADAARLHARVDGLLASAVHWIRGLRRAQGVARRPRRRVPQHRTADSDAVSRWQFGVCLDGHGRPGCGARAVCARRRGGVASDVRRGDGERDRSRSGCSAPSCGRPQGRAWRSARNAGWGVAASSSSPGVRWRAPATSSRPRSPPSRRAGCSPRGCCTPAWDPTRRCRASWRR